MKITIIAVVLGTLLPLAGCAARAPLAAGCGDVVAKKVTISYKRNNEIRVRPPERTIEQGQAIQFVFKGAAGTDVEVDGDTPNASWIRASGKGSPGGSKNYVCVKINQAENSYKYNVTVDGIGTLDPVVRVKTRGGGR